MNKNRIVINGSEDLNLYKANKPVLVNGSLNASEITVKDLTVRGSFYLVGFNNEINGNLLVQGSAEINNCQIRNNVKVQGSASINHTKINGVFESSSISNIQDSEINGDLIISAKTLTLNSNVLIKGKIIFKTQAGTLNIFGSNVKILGGIMNGKLQANHQNSQGPIEIP